DPCHKVHGTSAFGIHGQDPAERLGNLLWDGNDLPINAFMGVHTTAVDLVPSVPAPFGYFYTDAPQLLSSPLARVVVDDGRRFLDGKNRMMSSSWTPHHLHGPQVRARACSTQESSTRLSKNICTLMVCCRCGIRKRVAIQRCRPRLQRR